MSQPIRTTFSKLPLLTCAVVILLGCLVRVSLFNHPMRYDESYNYLRFVTKPPIYILTHYVPNNHILHTLMVWLVTKCFGDAPGMLRLPAFVAGVLLIPAMGCLAWFLSKRVVAVLMAMVLTGFSSAFIEYSCSARGYSWLALFAAGQLISLVIPHSMLNMRAGRIGWAVCGALGTLTVPIMLIGCVAQWMALAIYCLITRRSKGHLITMGVLYATLTALLYAPMWMSMSVDQIHATGKMSSDILYGQLPTPLSTLGSVWAFWMRDAGLYYGLVSILGISTAVYAAIRRVDAKLLLLIGSTFITVVTITAFNLPVPARGWLFLWPAVIALIACGIGHQFDWCVPRLPSPIAKLSAVACTALFLCIAASPVVNVLKSRRLCSEPNGLVEVEPAIQLCREHGIAQCGILSRYTPATAYYLKFHKLNDLALPASSQCQKVVLVAASEVELTHVKDLNAALLSDYSAPEFQFTVAETSYYLSHRLPSSGTLSSSASAQP